MPPILLVEDFPPLRDSLRRWLRLSLGERCQIEATCSEKAERAARAHLPQVIVVDVDMNGRPGLEVVRNLKLAAPAAAIVALALDESEAHRAAAQAAGAEFYAPKAELPEGLVDILEAAFASTIPTCRAQTEEAGM